MHTAACAPVKWPRLAPHSRISLADRFCPVWVPDFCQRPVSQQVMVAGDSLNQVVPGMATVRRHDKSRWAATDALGVTVVGW
jgi:hypothetical protein